MKDFYFLNKFFTCYTPARRLCHEWRQCADKQMNEMSKQKRVLIKNLRVNYGYGAKK